MLIDVETTVNADQITSCLSLFDVYECYFVRIRPRVGRIYQISWMGKKWLGKCCATGGCSILLF